MNRWSEILDVPYPACRQTGQCCRYSSPSTPGIELLKKARDGDSFARDFLTIFMPYSDISEVKNIHPALVEKNLAALKKTNCGKVTEENLVFYHCRFLAPDNNCLIYEDRPILCRDFPDSPYLVLPPNCAYLEWAENCKKKYKELKDDIEKRKTELSNLKYQRKAVRLLRQLQRVEDKYKPAFILPSLNLVSPGASWIKIFGSGPITTDDIK